jgi:hypothetical protein
MANLTFYKVSAFVYDMYCKSQLSDNKTPIYKIIEYHKIGKHIGEAMYQLGIYEMKGSKIIWKANAPTIELIEKIESKRKEIQDIGKAKYIQKMVNKKKELPKISEVDQYKDALEKALLRINELESKKEIQQPVKKSFISKLFN